MPRLAPNLTDFPGTGFLTEEEQRIREMELRPIERTVRPWTPPTGVPVGGAAPTGVPPVPPQPQVVTPGFAGSVAEFEAQQRAPAEAKIAQEREAITRLAGQRATAAVEGMAERPIRFDPAMERLKAYRQAQVITERKAEARGERVGEMTPQQVQRNFEKINAVLAGQEPVAPLKSEEFDSLRPYLMASKEGRRLLGTVQRQVFDLLPRLEQTVNAASSIDDITNLTGGLNPIVKVQAERLIQQYLTAPVAGTGTGTSKKTRLDLLTDRLVQAGLEEQAAVFNATKAPEVARAVVKEGSVVYPQLNEEQKRLADERAKEVERKRAMALNYGLYVQQGMPGADFQDFLVNPEYAHYDERPDGKFELVKPSPEEAKRIRQVKSEAEVAMAHGFDDLVHMTPEAREAYQKAHNATPIAMYGVEVVTAEPSDLSAGEADTAATKAGLKFAPPEATSTVTLPAGGERQLAADVVNAIQSQLREGGTEPDVNAVAADVLAKALMPFESEITQADFIKATSKLVGYVRADLKGLVDTEARRHGQEVARRMEPELRRMDEKNTQFAARMDTEGAAVGLAAQYELPANATPEQISNAAWKAVMNDLDLGTETDSLARQRIVAAMEELQVNPVSDLVPDALKTAYESRRGALQQGVAQMAGQQAQKEAATQQYRAQVAQAYGPEAVVVWRSPEDKEPWVVFDKRDPVENGLAKEWVTASPNRREQIVAEYQANADAVKTQAARQVVEKQYPDKLVSWVPGTEGATKGNPIFFPNNPYGKREKQEYDGMSTEERKTQAAVVEARVKEYAPKEVVAENAITALTGPNPRLYVKRASVVMPPEYLSPKQKDEWFSRPGQVAWDFVEPRTEYDWDDYSEWVDSEFAPYPELRAKVQSSIRQAKETVKKERAKTLAELTRLTEEEVSAALPEYMAAGAEKRLTGTARKLQKAELAQVEKTQGTRATPVLRPDTTMPQLSVEEAAKLPKGTEFIDVNGVRRRVK